MLPFLHFLIPLASFLFFLHKWLRRKNLPPSPSKIPVIGNLHQLGLSPHRSLQSLSKRYGPLMLLHLGRLPVLVVSSADAAREIMKSQDSVFSNRPKLRVPGRIFYGSKDVAFAQYGEYWRQMRSICVNQLLSPKRVQSFRRVRDEETSLLVAKMLRRVGSVVNLSEEMVALSNDVVCRVALGRKYSIGEEGKEFKRMLREAGELLGTFCVGDYIPWLGWVDWVSGLDDRLERVAKEIDDFFGSVVEEHRLEKKGDEEGSDFVDILLGVQGENKVGSMVDNDAIKAIIFDMFAAGTDTSSTALEWTMAELIKNPSTMKQLQKEVREVGGSKEEIEEEDLEKMPYLKAVIKESLRLHSPVPLLVPRESTRDTKVMGYDVVAGTQVIINAWSIARDPLLWENPLHFQPERFLSSNIDFKGVHFEFTPFGAGRRGCPGASFSTAVNELALAKMVHKFDFDLPDGAEKVELDMTEDAGITIHLKFPLLVVATPYACSTSVVKEVE
ncbi:hypothetical protein ACS0TY_034918 [Phlomoides rotata]